MVLIVAALLLTPLQWVGGGVERYATFESPETGRGIERFSFAGDLNADGTEDLLLGLPEYRNGWRTGAGMVLAISGKDRGVLFRLLGERPHYSLGNAMDGLGDANGDGFNDVIIGARRVNIHEPNYGYVKVLSGADGSVLFFVENDVRYGFLGTNVHGVGDLNQDGFADFAYMTEDGAGSTDGAIVVASGLTGLPLYVLDGTDSGGFSPAFYPVGDLDGDSLPDLVAVADTATFLVEAVQAFSGATGAQLWKTSPSQRAIGFGVPAVSAGDMDGDGSEDVLVGAGSWTSPAGVQLGACYLLSGADGRIVRITTGFTEYSDFGRNLAGGRDFDEDGIPDYLIGAGRDDLPGSVPDTGAVHLFSGRTGHRLTTLAGSRSNGYFGHGIGVPRQPAGAEGNAVFVLEMARGSGSTWRSAIDAWIFRPYLRLEAHELSAAQGGTVSAVLDFPEALGGLNYSLLLSASGRGLSQFLGLDIPLTRDALLEATVRGHYPAGTHGGRGILDAGGNADVEFRLAPGRVPPGRTIHLAAVAWDPATRIPLASSIAAELRLGP